MQGEQSRRHSVMCIDSHPGSGRSCARAIGGENPRERSGVLIHWRDMAIVAEWVRGAGCAHGVVLLVVFKFFWRYRCTEKILQIVEDVVARRRHDARLRLGLHCVDLVTAHCASSAWFLQSRVGVKGLRPRSAQATKGPNTNVGLGKKCKSEKSTSGIRECAVTFVFSSCR